jgi:sugar transferase (PEP-CTERM/EpsH1 system associated)
MHLVFSLETGGLENGVVNLCNRLDPERFRPVIAVFQGGGALECRVDRGRVELFELNKLWNNDPSLPFRLAWRLVRGRIDVLHSHSWGTLLEGVVAARLARTPAMIHGEHGILEKRRRNVWLQRLMWGSVQHLTAVASPLADDMADLAGIARDRIKVISNGVDTDRFAPRPEVRNAFRQRLGIRSSDLLIGMVARLVPVKNHHGVLEAVGDLVRAGVPVSLALAGDGPLLGELQRVCDGFGLSQRVHFLGDLADVEEFYNSLDLFVLNSHSEGMSNTILEAMASGLPVIATSVGSNPVLVVDGETGFLVSPGVRSALTRAIAILAKDDMLRQSMGRQGRIRIELHFGIDRMVDDYSALYDELGRELVHFTCSSNDATSRLQRTELELKPTR